jgi:uncharacterized protein YggE
MKKALLLTSLLLAFAGSAFAQESGNRIYGANAQRKVPQTNTGNLASVDRKSYSIEASVLMNVRPDAYVAVFGIQQEGPTPSESNAKVDVKADALTKAFNALGVRTEDIYIDFITQNRVYDYKSQGQNVVEVPAGFETKKTFAVKYKTRDQFVKITAEAAKLQIFDLIKVDYIVSDFEAVRAKLFEEAANVIKAKEARYALLFKVKLPPMGLANEKYDAFYPAELYQQYQAYESGSGSTSYERGTTVTRRKVSTFYYEPQEADKFDKVINPIGIEPMVQFTVYLRMDYDSGIVMVVKEK